MKIKGIVQQIIKPEEQKDYFNLPSQGSDETKNKFYIRIISNDLPKMGFIKRKIFEFRNRNLSPEEFPAWTVVMDKVDFKEGDKIELDIERLKVKSGIFEVKQ